MKLRPYQIEALDAIRRLYRAGTKKVLLHLATGGGKTVVFCEVLKGAVEKGSRAVVVVRGKELVAQHADRLSSYGIPFGIIQANSIANENAPVQICSIDTLVRRKKIPQADLLVIDEAHHAQSKGYKWLADAYEGKFFLSVTASPWPMKSIQHVAQAVVSPITMDELATQGYLVRPEYFVPQSKLFSGKIKRKNGDFDQSELSRMADENSVVIFGNALEEYRKHANGLRTLIFCVDVNHSKTTRDRFISEGITAEHIDADTPDGERRRILRDFVAGDIRIITNVGVLTTGVDVPQIEALMFLRPTLSLNLFIQMLGRGTRPSEGKEKFVVLDLVGNVDRHGCPYEKIREPAIEGLAAERKARVCVSCYVAYYPDESKGCPACGFVAVRPDDEDEIERKRKKGETDAYELTRRIQPLPSEIEKLSHDVLHGLVASYIERGKTQGALYYMLLGKYKNKEAINDLLSRFKRTKLCTDELKAWLNSSFQKEADNFAQKTRRPSWGNFSRPRADWSM